ncbi:MAG TPA: hypothetical protein VGE93_16510, partial [Bryobacteraceae bacterium]
CCHTGAGLQEAAGLLRRENNVRGAFAELSLADDPTKTRKAARTLRRGAVTRCRTDGRRQVRTADRSGVNVVVGRQLVPSGVG